MTSRCAHSPGNHRIEAVQPHDVNGVAVHEQVLVDRHDFGIALGPLGHLDSGVVPEEVEVGLGKQVLDRLGQDGLEQCQRRDQVRHRRF